jgi:hypothetical protein
MIQTLEVGRGKNNTQQRIDKLILLLDHKTITTSSYLYIYWKALETPESSRSGKHLEVSVDFRWRNSLDVGGSYDGW